MSTQRPANFDHVVATSAPPVGENHLVAEDGAVCGDQHPVRLVAQRRHVTCPACLRGIADGITPVSITNSREG